MDMLARASELAAAGLSVIPAATSGAYGKKPVGPALPQICDWPRKVVQRTGAPDSGRGHGSWLDYQRRIATLEIVHGVWRPWFPPGEERAIAVVAGAVSGGLLVIDFDGEGFFERWRAVVTLPAGVFVQRTGGGGYQVWLRCRRPGRNDKLAWRVELDTQGQPARDERGRARRTIAIETRGEGGYAIVAPSLHPSGRRYETLIGDPCALPVQDDVTVATLLAAARGLDETPPEETRRPPTSRTRESTYRPQLNGEGSVIDQFNQVVPIADALSEARYAEVTRGAFAGRWARPGSKSGDPSVVVRDGRSFHHATNDPLSDGYWHTSFDVYCATQHDGDVKAAVKAAAKRLGLPPLKPHHAGHHDGADVAPWLDAPHPAGDGPAVTPTGGHGAISGGFQVFAPLTVDAHVLPDGPLPEPPPDEGPHFRGLRVDREPASRPPAWPGDAMTPEYRDLVQDSIRHHIFDYLGTVFDGRPPHECPVLLLRLSPGARKTSTSVEIAEFLAEPDELGRQRRVAYYGPRHTLFQDLMAEARHRPWWHEWKSRQLADELKGKTETCHHAPAMSTWLYRGHEAMTFCERICGWQFIKDECVYHAQKRTTRPILYLQHQHLWAGVPGDLHATVAFGDELPLSAMLWQWEIPARFVVPQGLTLERDHPLAELLTDLRRLAEGEEEERRLAGPALLDALGGADAVLATIADYEARKAALPEQLPSHADRGLGEAGVEGQPARRRRKRMQKKRGGGRRAQLDGITLRRASDVEHAPYRYVRDLLWHLRREAREQQAGATFEARVVVGGGKVMLLQRRRLHGSVPPHLIWLDGTGDADLYSAILGRPVQIVELALPLQGTVRQVVNRAYGKRALLETREPEPVPEHIAPPHVDPETGEVLDEPEGAPQGEQAPPGPAVVLTRQGGEAMALIRHLIATRGYERPGLISFQDVTRQSGDGWHALAHFYGARGSNAFTDRKDRPGVDALFILGTPLPDPFALHNLAKMLYLERMEPFDLTWSDEPQPYAYVAPDGTGRSYPVSGFWRERSLQTLVEQLREMEIVQAAERARLRLRAVDVWLLLNLPLADLPPHEILTAQQLLNEQRAPVDPYRWAQLLAVADERYRAGDALTSADIVAATGVSATTARRYLSLLQEAQPERWEVAALTPKGRGRPAAAMRPVPTEKERAA